MKAIGKAVPIGWNHEAIFKKSDPSLMRSLSIKISLVAANDKGHEDVRSKQEDNRSHK